MIITDAVRHVLDWLRAGYPSGIPQEDYVALFGVLHRRLTEDEVLTVAEQLAAERGIEIDEAEIRDRVEQLVRQKATDEDVQRVSAALARGGWPLAPVPDEESGIQGSSEHVADAAAQESEGQTSA